jgi:signal transduction histidine kinase
MPARHRSDVVLAAVLAAGAQAEVWLSGYDSRPLLAATTLVCCLALAERRRRPLAVGLLVALAFAAGQSLTGLVTELATGTLPVLLSTYTAAALLALRPALAAGAATFAAAQLSAVVGAGTPSVSSSAYAALVVGVAWGVGRVVAARHEHVAVLEERNRLLERERDTQARAAVAAERARLSRELHDVVAHGVSLMVVQAGAAEGVLRTRPEAAQQALREVRTAGREALAELRRMLDLLRDDPREGDAPAPAPGLADLPALAQAVGSSGLRVDLRMPECPPVPQALGLSAYRIVQEALTNALKHAGGTCVVIDVRSDGTALAVEVCDDGRGTGGAPNAPGGAGHGLVGMRERVGMFGGTLEAGPTGAGWRVRALLPLDRA